MAITSTVPLLSFFFIAGDIAQYTNGYYRLLGRASADIIKSGGHKLSALQIETDLLANPYIADCAVVGLADPVWGQRVRMTKFIFITLFNPNLILT